MPDSREVFKSMPSMSGRSSAAPVKKSMPGSKPAAKPEAKPSEAKQPDVADPIAKAIAAQREAIAADIKASTPETRERVAAAETELRKAMSTPAAEPVAKSLTPAEAIVAYHNAVLDHPVGEQGPAAELVAASDSLHLNQIVVQKSLQGTVRYTQNGKPLAHHYADEHVTAETPAFSAIATPQLKKSLEETTPLTYVAGGPSDTSYGPLADKFTAEGALMKANELSKGGVASFVYYGGGSYRVCVDQAPGLRHHEGRGYIEFRKGMAPMTHFTDVEGRQQRVDYQPHHLGIAATV